MDISATLTPNSAQLNAEDLLAGPITVTIVGVDESKTEQPVFISLAEIPGRTYRPNLTMRRLLVSCWGAETSDYIGRRMTLFRDPTVKFGGQAVGGIVVSHVSHIDAPRTIALMVTRGKRKDFTVRPLENASDPVQAWGVAINKCETTEELVNTWTEIQAAHLSTNEQLIHAKDTRKAELTRAAQIGSPE